MPFFAIQTIVYNLWQKRSTTEFRSSCSKLGNCSELLCFIGFLFSHAIFIQIHIYLIYYRSESIVFSDSNFSLRKDVSFV
ncbi:uncharacterized protein Gasu_44540 [Galdieria sulphuraria]|uniref:Uncharacterized protein n=1 Tax=Galdieria sulphuraria TaxID=130081 RepID=M2XDB5_GALSU|nr:uncharacterized protein Gasu_44540 [Galdieria sulphuraria]EME27947.1 hypothetical protein Gasu_44540 [Galdieria sulphuraria]|eukprot:XP_005704467.1 hypothetical protein Gasu_44540 [Galdieria sulphuraria]